MAKIHQLDEMLQGRSDSARKRGASGFAPVAKIEAPAEGAAGDELRWVDVDSIDDNPFQPRLSYPNKEQLEMVSDLNRDGQLQAGLARRHPTKAGRFELASAHRRKYAVKEGAYFKNPDTGEETRVYANAGSQQPSPREFEGQMQIVVRADISDEQMRRYGYKENKSRLDLKPLELAKYYNATRAYLTDKLRHAGQIGPHKEASWRAVGEFLEENFRTIHRIARLVELPANMRKALEEGVLNEHHGRALMELAQWDKEQRLLFADIKKHGWSGARAEKVAAERKDLLNQKIPTRDSLIDEAVEAELDKREKAPAQKAQDKTEEEEATNRRQNFAIVSGTEEAAPEVAAPDTSQAPPQSEQLFAAEIADRLDKMRGEIKIYLWHLGHTAPAAADRERLAAALVSLSSAAIDALDELRGT